jgi:hypothetical protein
MNGYSITKNGNWLSSMNALQTGKLSFVVNPEFRAIYETEDKAIAMCKFYDADKVINEYSGLTVYPVSGETKGDI